MVLAGFTSSLMGCVWALPKQVMILHWQSQSTLLSVFPSGLRIAKDKNSRHVKVFSEVKLYFLMYTCLHLAWRLKKYKRVRQGSHLDDLMFQIYRQGEKFKRKFRLIPLRHSLWHGTMRKFIVIHSTFADLLLYFSKNKLYLTFFFCIVCDI